MSLENVTTIEISVMEAQAAIAVAAAERLVSPARRLYVFGGADGTFPYYATFSAAITAANALTPAPSTTNPVSVVLLSNTNGTPVTISGNDDWYALCLDGIYVSSPYREIFSTTTLPTTLPKGMRVLYRSGGNETLYVGNDSNVAQLVNNVPTEFSFAVSGAFADVGTITFSNNMTASKSGRLVVINSGLGFTVPPEPDWVGLFNLTGIPETLWPSDGAVCVVLLGLPELGYVQRAGTIVQGSISFNIDPTDMTNSFGTMTISASYFTD